MEKSPTLQPIRQPKVLRAARRQVWRHLQEMLEGMGVGSEAAVDDTGSI